MRRISWLLAAIPFAILALVLTARARGGDDDAKSLVGKAAPDFSLSTVDGKGVKLSDQKGNVVVVDFWATWCPPCRRSLPHIQQLSGNKEDAGKGLVVWAVNAREEKADVQAFLKQNNFSFTVPMDAAGATMEQYLVQGIPTTVIVGRDGSVKNVFVGFDNDSAKAVDDAVEKALSEPAPGK